MRRRLCGRNAENRLKKAGPRRVIIYAVTKDYLKNIPVAKIQDYQEKLFTYMQDEHPEILQSITDTKDLTAENETALQEALIAFGSQYTAEV